MSRRKRKKRHYPVSTRSVPAVSAIPVSVSPQEATCFKCKTKYESSDASDKAGDGYCPPCLEIKKAIAAELDKKFLNRPAKKKPLRYDDLPKIRGFVNARDLGITFP